MATQTLTAPPSAQRPLDHLWSIGLVLLYIALALTPLLVVGR